MGHNTYLIQAPVSDGDFLSPDISQQFERMYLSVTFYSDAAYTTPVTPTAGTVTITATDDGFNYGTLTDGTVDATNPAYLRPNMSGRVRKVKATVAGVTGATHFRVVANNYI